MNGQLFSLPDKEIFAEGAVLLRGFLLPSETALLSAIHQLIAQAPLRHMITPGGYTMSVAMTNCGERGWVSDRTSYRYSQTDPLSGEPWPAMPTLFHELAISAATKAGYPDFKPDACLINHYVPGTKLSLHQDKDEHDITAPIVSFSLGLPAMFQFGGLQRSDKLKKIPLQHGDAVVWGGPSRMVYHGILPLKPGHHPLLGEARYNLTFRKAS